MRSLSTLLALVVMAMVLSFCAATTPSNPAQHISSNAGDLTSTLLPNNTGSPNNSTDGFTPAKSQNRCYDWDKSEKWKDVGGQHSEFVEDAVYALCQLIAIDAYKGFPSGNTIKHCMEVRPGIQGKRYARSIGISLRYTGPLLEFDKITAGYCLDRMTRPMDCGAGGEFDLYVNNPNLPYPWVSDRWETKADPNRGNCRSNRYTSDLGRLGQGEHD